MDSDPQRYLKSIAEAAVSQSRQVRDLIGGRHWLSDGRHKEALLAGLIRRYAPASTLVCSGFVLHPTDPSLCSKEQDILVLDTLREAPLFHHSGLAVALPNTVLAAISVKTQFRTKELTDACEGLNSVIAVAASALSAPSLWCGAYFFEDPPSSNAAESSTTIRGVLESVRPPVAGIAAQPKAQLGPDVLASSGKLFAKLSYASGPAKASLTAYDTDLSAALFLAHLIDHIATRRGASEASLIAFADSSLSRQISPVMTFDLGATPI